MRAERIIRAFLKVGINIQQQMFCTSPLATISYSPSILGGCLERSVFTSPMTSAFTSPKISAFTLSRTSALTSLMTSAAASCPSSTSFLMTTAKISNRISNCKVSEHSHIFKQMSFFLDLLNHYLPTL